MLTVETPSQQSFYSVDDIQRILGIGRNSAYKLVKEVGFPAIYVGNRIVTPINLFQTWIDEQATSTNGMKKNSTDQ